MRPAPPPSHRNLRCQILLVSQYCRRLRLNWCRYWSSRSIDLGQSPRLPGRHGRCEGLTKRKNRKVEPSRWCSALSPPNVSVFLENPITTQQFRIHSSRVENSMLPHKGVRLKGKVLRYLDKSFGAHLCHSE